MAWFDYKKAHDMVSALMGPDMPGDGWSCQEYNLHNQQKHDGELEDSTDIRRDSPWTG